MEREVTEATWYRCSSPFSASSSALVVSHSADALSNAITIKQDGEQPKVRTKEGVRVPAEVHQQRPCHRSGAAQDATDRVQCLLLSLQWQ